MEELEDHDDTWADPEPLCECGRESCISCECEQCGKALCGMCAETGTGFCSRCPTKDYEPPGYIDVQGFTFLDGDGEPMAPTDWADRLLSGDWGTLEEAEEGCAGIVQFARAILAEDRSAE